MLARQWIWLDALVEKRKTKYSVLHLFIRIPDGDRLPSSNSKLIKTLGKEWLCNRQKIKSSQKKMEAHEAPTSSLAASIGKPQHLPFGQINSYECLR